VFVSEEELTVEVAQVNCIEIDDVNVAEPGEDEVFQ
jgi:hypothetical protein